MSFSLPQGKNKNHQSRQTGVCSSLLKKLAQVSALLCLAQFACPLVALKIKVIVLNYFKKSSSMLQETSVFSDCIGVFGLTCLQKEQEEKKAEDAKPFPLAFMRSLTLCVYNSLKGKKTLSL